MSFTPVGTMGTVASDASAATIVITPTGTIAAGSVVVASFGARSIALTEFEETNTHTTLVDTKGNTWSKFGERTNSGGFAEDGQCSSMWWCQLTAALLTSDTVTLTMSASVAVRFGALRVWTVGVGETVAFGAYFTNAAFTTTPNGEAYWAPNVPSLWVNQVAYRNNAGGLTPDAGWTTDLTELSGSTGCFWGQSLLQTVEEDSWAAVKTSGARWASVTGVLSIRPLPNPNATRVAVTRFLSPDGGNYGTCQRLNDRYPQYDYVESVPSPTPDPERQRYHVMGNMIRSDVLDVHVARLETAPGEPYHHQRIRCWRSNTNDTTSFAAFMCAYLNPGATDGDWDVLYLYAGLQREGATGVTGVIGWIDAAGTDHSLADTGGTPIPMDLDDFLTLALRTEPASGGGVTARLTISSGGSPDAVLDEITAPVPAALLLSGHNHVGVYSGAALVPLFPQAYGGVAISDHEIFETVIPTPIAPCSLHLRVYEDDRTTIRWEVSTDPNHAAPYLMAPDQYATQELDVAAGRASIGTVTVGVIDPMTVAGDQDSGWMTARLAYLSLADIIGRRCVLLRYINDTIGYNVVADGPAGNPVMGSDYSSFRWAIRDTRETERKLRAFESIDWCLIPDQPLAPYGDPSDYLIWTTSPTSGYNGLVGEVSAYPGASSTPAAVFIEVGLSVYPENGRRLILWQSAYDAIMNQIGRVGGDGDTNRRFTFQWRIKDSATPWNVVPGEFLEVTLSTAPSTVTESGRVLGQLHIHDRRMDPTRPEYDALIASVPADNDVIEFQLLGPLAPDEQHPILIENIQAGTFLANLYDGAYSYREDDGTIIPTGIRYDAAAVAAMTTLVRWRGTEMVPDVRAFAEKYVYPAAGYVPALAADGTISPVSRTAPADVTNLPALTDVNCEPAPEWSGGDQIYNVISFTYYREYSQGPPDPPFTNPPWADPSLLSMRPDVVGGAPVTIEYEDTDSVNKIGRKVLAIDGGLYRDIGFAITTTGNEALVPNSPILRGQRMSPAAWRRLQASWRGIPRTDVPVVPTGVHVAPLTTLQAETGWQLADAANTDLLSRYARGAPTLGVKVRRSDVPTLREGSWVVLDLSWLPDYATGARNLLALGQVVALGELDCAWRYATVEVVVPPAIAS